MNELLRMFLSQNDIVDFFKRKQLSRKEIPSDELFRVIRSVKGLESLVAAKRVQTSLITEGVITKTANHLYRVNADYVFSDMDKEKVDLKGWNIAHYKRDIPEDLIKNETAFVCVDDSGVPHIVYAKNDNSWDNVVFEKYNQGAVFLPILWKRLDIPDNVFGIIYNTDTNSFE